MSCIHFKFKNRQDYEKVPISGLEVSGKELKEAIMKKKKIGHSNLQITDAQTKKVYSDTDMIKRNASVIVMRSVIQNAAKLPKTQHKDPSLLPTTGLEPTTITPNQNDPQKASDLTSLTGSEEEKLMVMMKQAGEGYTAEDYAKYPTRPGIHPGFFRGPPPRGYVCNRCRKPGHWIQLCPTNGDPNFDRRNRQDLLPKTSTVGVKSKHIMAAPKEKEVPDELKCPLCKQPLRDAVIIPCCSKSFCDECIREHLLEKEFTCPLCKEEDVSPDSLVPNKELRESVKQFKSQAAEEKGIAVASLFSHASLAPHQLSTSRVPPKAPITTSTPSLPSQFTSKVTATLPTTTSTTSTPVTAASTSSSSSRITNSPRMRANESDESKPAAVEPPVVPKSAGEDDVKKSDEQDVKQEEMTTAASPPPETDKEGEKAGSGANLAIPSPMKREDRSSSPQCSRSKSPSPFESRKPTQPIVPTHRKPTHPRSNRPLSTLHPHLPLMTGLSPPILPLPLLHNQMAPTALSGNASLLNTLPGLGVVPTVGPLPIVKDYQAEAEFLLGPKRTRPASPPPLTAEEFYRQQKILNQFILHKSPAHSIESELDHSPSSDSESNESDSYSSSDSVSESDTSTFSHSPSRSVSPQKKKRRHHTSSRKPENSHRHKKKHGKEPERERERGKERHKRKRRRNETSDEIDNRRRHSKRHRHRVPKSRDASLDVYHQSSDAVSSATSETAHHNRHRKTKKRKHRHHHRRAQEGRGFDDSGTVGVERYIAGEEVKLLGGGQADGSEVGVVENSAMAIAGDGGEVPEISVAEAMETVGELDTPDNAVREELCLKCSPAVGVKRDVASSDAPVIVEPPLPVVGGEVLSDTGVTTEMNESAGITREINDSTGVARKTNISAGRTGSGDTLLDDIDQLLAEDDQTSETPRPAHTSSKGTCIDEDLKPELEERESDLPCGDTGGGGRIVTAVVAAVEEEGDHLSLHAEETIDDEEDGDTAAIDILGTTVDGELEEGELLSDVDADRVPGLVDPTCSDGLQQKPRLRSVASTVQVVNSSETPELTPSDIESPELSPLPLPPPSPTPPPSPEPAREVIQPVKRKHHHHHHREQAQESGKNPKKRKKSKNKETMSTGHRHQHKRQERGEEREGRKGREERGKVAKKHGHRRKKHRHSSS